MNDINTARYQTNNGLGRTYTAALLVGGRTPPSAFVANTESWNGTSWSEVNDINTARGFMSGQTGTSSSAFVAGGNPPYTAKNEHWNGVSWQETSDLNTARGTLAGGAADFTSGVAFGGNSPPITGATEEWSSTSNTTKTISTD